MELKQIKEADIPTYLFIFLDLYFSLRGHGTAAGAYLRCIQLEGREHLAVWHLKRTLAVLGRCPENSSTLSKIFF